MKLITLILIFLSGSLAQRKFLQTKELDVPPQRPTGRGAARFTKTEEFQQVSTDYEKASRNERQRTNYDTPRQPQNRRPPKVITEDNFQITNSQLRPQVFEPAPQYSPGRNKPVEPVKYETPNKIEISQSYETTSEVGNDFTEISSEISKATSEISSSTTSTTTTTTTIKPSTKNTITRTRGRNVGSSTITSTTTIASRTRGQRKPASRQNIGGVETISEPPKTNFRSGRRRTYEQNSLKGKGPSVIDGADNLTRSRNERTANPNPGLPFESARSRNERTANPNPALPDEAARSRNERTVNSNPTASDGTDKPTRRIPSSRRRSSSSSTLPPPNSSTNSELKRTREKRPETSTETRSLSGTRASRRNVPTRSETITSPKSVDRSSRGRSRSRFVDVPKKEPQTESTVAKTTIRARESRQRHTVINEELASSSTVENPIRILAPVSASNSVTQKIEPRADTVKPNEIIQIGDLDEQKNKQRVKETVTSEVSEVVSSRKVTRRRKVKTVARNQNSNAPTKIKLDVNLNLDDDDLGDLNYPPQYKALLAAKAKESNLKNKKVLLIKKNANSISTNKKLTEEKNEYPSSTAKALKVISSTTSILLKPEQVTTLPSPSNLTSTSTFTIISSTTVAHSSSSPSSLNDNKSSTGKLESSSRPSRRRLSVSTKSPKRQENEDSRKTAVTKAEVTKASTVKAPVTKAQVTKPPVTKATITKAPVTKAPRKTFERSTSVPNSDNSSKQKYHARFREAPIKESEKKISPSFTKVQSGPRNYPSRKPLKTGEENRSAKNNEGNVTQAPIVQHNKKTNRYSSRYRGEFRDSSIRASTSSPVYTPTIPTITSHYQKRGHGNVHTEERDGLQIITIDDPSNLLYSDNLVDDKTTDKSIETETKPSSIFERIINSITSISTTSKPNTERKPKPITESTAILKITTKKPRPDPIELNIIPKDASSEKPTTVIERILNSLSAIQATDHVGTSSNTSNVSNNIVSSTIANTNGGSTIGDLYNLFGLAQTKQTTNSPLDNEISESMIPRPISSTTQTPKSTIAISLADYLALLNKERTIVQSTSEDLLENTIDFSTTYKSFIPITTESFPTTTSINFISTTTGLPIFYDVSTTSSNFVSTNNNVFSSEIPLVSTEFISSSEYYNPTTTVTELDISTSKSDLINKTTEDLGSTTEITASTTDISQSTSESDTISSTITEPQLTSEIPEVTSTTDSNLNTSETTTFKVSLNSVTITSSNELNNNEDDSNAVTIISKGSFSTNNNNNNTNQQRNKSARLLLRDQDQILNNNINQSTTTKPSDYFIFAVLPNNTIVRKRAPKRVNAPYIIVGLYPNNTIVRKFPNGSIVPDEAVVQDDRKIVDISIDQLYNDVDANVKDTDQKSSEVSEKPTVTAETTTNLSTLTNLLGRKVSREFENILSKTLDGTTSTITPVQSTLVNDADNNITPTTNIIRVKTMATTFRMIPSTRRIESTTNTIPPRTTNTIPPRTTNTIPPRTTNTIPPRTTNEPSTSTDIFTKIPTTSYTTPSGYLTTFLSSLRPVYTPPITTESLTRRTTDYFMPTTETEVWNNLVEETTPTIVTITARRKTTPEPTSISPITSKSKRNNSRRRTTTMVPTTEGTTERTTTMSPVVTYITTVNNRRRTTVPTTVAPTTTVFTTTTERFTSTIDPKDVNIDDLLKNTKKPLTDQQRQDLEVLKALEKQQADLLQQLAFLTNFNLGGKQGESVPKRSSENSNIANRVINFAIDRNKETTTEVRIPSTTTELPNPGRKVILSDTEITTIDELLKEINLKENQNNPALSTYGNSQEALIAALLKERGIQPSTPKTLRDKIKQNNVFNTETPTTIRTTTTRRPRTTTTERAGRLMQGLSWILNALGPPPTTRRPKPKTTRSPTIATATDLEDLWHEPTERQTTRITTNRPTTRRKPVNSLTQEELQRLLVQLEEIQQDPTKAKNLDLKPLKNLAGSTTTTRILENKHVEISSSGHTGSKKVTRAPKAQYENEASQSTRSGKSKRINPVTPGNSIEDVEEFVSKPPRSSVKSRPTLPPVELDPVPGLNDDNPVIGGRFLSAAVNVTRALSTFLGSAIQVAARQVASMLASGSGSFGLSSSSPQ